MRIQCGLTSVMMVLLLLVFVIGLNLGIHGALHTQLAHGPADITTSKVEATTAPPAPPAFVGDAMPHLSVPPISKQEEKVVVVAPQKTKLAEEKLPAVIKVGSPNPGVIENYVASGKKFPILLITCNRPDLLKVTLNSLLSVSGVSAGDILVVQDGSMLAVGEAVSSRGIKVVQNTRGLQLRGGAAPDGASRIATHYKFALTTAFAEYPEAPAVIVVEDDLLFSPDFMEYFHVAAPILDQDKTVFALSAWSDNGFIGKVKDPYKLDRTDYFPGLGWLITRELYTTELEPNWPRAHWDHWLRSEEINKNREIVHPEVPRSFHNGIKGTFMDLTMHNLYFRDIAYNTDPSVAWGRHQQEVGRPVYMDAVSENYEADIARLVTECIHVKSVAEVMSIPGKLNKHQLSCHVILLL
jgi:hypothetical protein